MILAPSICVSSSSDDAQVWAFVHANLNPEPRREYLSLLNFSADGLNAEVSQVTGAPVGTFDAQQLPDAPAEQSPQEGMFAAEAGSQEALICKAIGSGNFEAAVDLCLSQGNLTDALMLGINGG